MEMSNLDDYLARREQDRRHGGPMSEAQLNAVLLSERGASMWKEVREATRGTAPRVGAIDGIPLEWDDGQVAGPLLRLRPVGAQFKQVKSAPSGGSLRGYRVVFGWITTDSGTETRALPNRVWNLTLSCNEGALTWDVNRDEIIGASSIELAEQIVKQLVEFRDEYMLKAYGKISN